MEDKSTIQEQGPRLVLSESETSDPFNLLESLTEPKVSAAEPVSLIERLAR